MKKLLLIALLAPTLASANDCEFSRVLALPLDLAGVKSIRIDVNSHELQLGPAGAAGPSVKATACASSQARLDELVLEQERIGDTLVIRAERRGDSGGFFTLFTHANLEIQASLPADLAYDVRVGSGDAWVSGLSRLRADVGSGDLDIEGIAGLVEAEVGSGDLRAHDIGALRVVSVGSGDLEASGIRGGARVQEVGSGDLRLIGVDGDVEIASVGSGDAEVSDVSGNLRVSHVGSGDVSPSQVRGRIDLPADD